MKTITTLALSAALAMGAVMANAQATTGSQQNPPPAMKAHHQQMMKKIADELGLTTDQRSQIKSIQEKFRPKFQELRSANLSTDAKKTQFKALRTQVRVETMKVLTPAQRAKFEAMRAMWKAEHQGKKAGK